MSTPPVGKWRIFLVDDHPMIRERLTELINREPDLRVCGEAESASSARSALQTITADLALVDLSLKGSSGIELLKDLRLEWPDLKLLVLSMHDESLYAERVLRSGARGYITKQEATTQVLNAIRKVLDGGVYLSPRMTDELLQRCSDGREFGASPLSLLTDRELEVVQRIGRGQSTRQIAIELNLSVKTVETYRERIKEKLGLKNGMELVQHAVRWRSELESNR